MRILFTTFVGLGHFFPLVPLAWAARAAGHDVLFVSAGPPVEACARAGLPAVDAAPGLDLMQMMRGRREAWARQGLPEGASPFAQDPLSRPEWRPRIAARLAEVGGRMLDGTVDAARAWRPDLVVHTPLEAAGPVAAAILGVPRVLHGLGPAALRPGARGGVQDMASLISEALRPAAERHGWAGPVPAPAAAVDICPPSMRPEGGAADGVAWTARYIPYNGGGALPGWLLESAPRPRLCLTLGTVLPGVAGVASGPLGAVLQAVRDLPVDVVLALGGADASALGELPSNVFAIGWLPLSALVPTCAAVVHHGGAGTTMNALVAGVPQLVLPHTADQPENAAAVEARGAGAMLRLDEATPQAVSERLHRLLEDPGCREAARQVSREIAALPAPADLVPRLADLVA